jgi:hypothetical protein
VVFIFIINVRRSRTELLLCVRDGVERCAWCSFHYKCAPLLHRIATLYPPRSIMVLRCVRGAHFQLHWLSLAVPGCSWAAPGLLLAAPGCSWLLLGCSWAAHGCSWLLLAASGCSWWSLAGVNVNSRSKENNLFGVLRCDHNTVY